MPNVHCYCFSTAGDVGGRSTDVQQRIKTILGVHADKPLDIEVRDVRDVAPNKYMVCAHFTLPEDVGYPGEASSQAEKRLKSDS